MTSISTDVISLNKALRSLNTQHVECLEIYDFHVSQAQEEAEAVLAACYERDVRELSDDV